MKYFNSVTMLLVMGIIALVFPLSTALGLADPTTATDAISQAASILSTPVSPATAASYSIFYNEPDPNPATPTISTAATLASIVYNKPDPSPIGPIPQDIDTNPISDQPEQDLEKRYFSPELLVHWDLRCRTNEAATMPRWGQNNPDSYPYTPAGMLEVCKFYWTCSALTGAMSQVPLRPGQHRRTGVQYRQRVFCQERCWCEIIDAPVLHYSAYFGCLNPVGNWVAGGIDHQYKRGESEAFEHPDGLMMQAYFGPERKMV